MKDNKSLLIAGIVSFLIVFGLVFPFSTVIDVSTAVKIQQNAGAGITQISTQVNTNKIPLFSFFASKASIRSIQTQDNSPIFDINYEVKLEGQQPVSVSGTQIKADVLVVRIPYYLYGFKDGNVSVNIPNFSYQKVIKVERR